MSRPIWAILWIGLEKQKTSTTSRWGKMLQDEKPAENELCFAVSSGMNTGWGLKTKRWWIDSAITKFIAFEHTFAIKIISSPKKRFSSPWVFVWKPENPRYGVKNQNCRRPMVWPIKTCARRALSQRKKLELNRTYQLREKSEKPPERTGFLEGPTDT